MAWTLYLLPSAQRGALEAALRDDQLSRQSQTIRDASTLSGPADSLYVLLEGGPEAVRRADELLGPLGAKPADAERVYRRIKEDEESASAGMGLFFTEG